jgi:two-component system sensor histidine kinase UhpB
VSLKLRLNLIITILLLLIMIAGLMLNIVNARENVLAEVKSTEKLVFYLFDTGIFQQNGVISQKNTEKSLHLQNLRHMRHVRIEFRDVSGKLIDSNRSADATGPDDGAPDWFESTLERVTPKLIPQKRAIEYQGHPLGELIITPDPTYEYAEIWKQIKDMFFLLSGFFVLVNLMISWAVSQALRPTDNILQALNSLESGNMKARLPEFDLPELARIGVKFNHMVETLEKSISRNHRLSQQLITLQEEERKNLARDLHDEFGQCLTTIKVDATVILNAAEKKYPEIQDSARAIVDLSKHLMELVGGLLQRLRPGILDMLGLVSALQDLVAIWKSRNEGIVCRLNIDDAFAEPASEAVQVTVYRMVQECLTNISRHAKATEVEIALSSRDGSNALPTISIQVRDNGAGFDPQKMEGFGLAGMRERVEGLGGQLAIHSAPGKGTDIIASIPLKEDSLA